MTVDGLAWMSERRLGVIATIGADGFPRAVPVELVVHDGVVWVWCHRTSVKARNVARARVATIVSYRNNDWVMVRGAATVITSGEDYDRVCPMFLAKYDRTETYGNDALIRIAADNVAVRVH